MAKAIEPVERGAVMAIGAGTVENVADVKDPAQLVRVHISQQQPEPPLLPPVIWRVTEGGKREGALRNWYWHRSAPRPDDGCNQRNTGDE
jgi:hypothetical protein